MTNGVEGKLFQMGIQTLRGGGRLMYDVGIFDIGADTLYAADVQGFSEPFYVYANIKRYVFKNCEGHRLLWYVDDLPPFVRDADDYDEYPIESFNTEAFDSWIPGW